MAKFYSKTTGGFYDTSINATMPPDAGAVTDAAYAALFAAQSAGQIIQSDANGNPEAVNPPAPTSAQVHAALQASAQAALDAARQQAAANHALTDRTSIEQHPDVRAAAATVRDAYLDYARNTLPAPVTAP